MFATGKPRPSYTSPLPGASFGSATFVASSLCVTRIRVVSRSSRSFMYFSVVVFLEFDGLPAVSPSDCFLIDASSVSAFDTVVSFLALGDPSFLDVLGDSLARALLIRRSAFGVVGVSGAGSFWPSFVVPTADESLTANSPPSCVFFPIVVVSLSSVIDLGDPPGSSPSAALFVAIFSFFFLALFGIDHSIAKSLRRLRDFLAARSDNCRR